MAVEAAPVGGTHFLAQAAEALARRLDAERPRWPLWLPVAFGGGIATYFALTFEPTLWAALGLVALGLALVIACRFRLYAFAAAAGLLAFALGFAVAKWSAERNAAPVIERRQGPVLVEARVIEVERLPE